MAEIEPNSLVITYRHHLCCHRGRQRDETTGTGEIVTTRHRIRDGVAFDVVAPYCIGAPSNGNMQLTEVSRRVE